MDLIKEVMSQLGTSETQTKGAVGSLLEFAKSKLGQNEFSSLTNHVPGAEDLMKEAPASGGLMDAAGGLISQFSGSSEAGGLASFAGKLSELGLDAESVGRFVPMVVSFLEANGGREISKIVEKAFSE